MNDDFATTMNKVSATDGGNTKSYKTIAMVVYALQAASFLLGITFIAAVIVNYVKKSDVHGTWLESHFRWQIRTFWFCFLWSVIGVITSFMVVGYILLIANAIWVLYRVVKGWLRLAEGKEMYTQIEPYKAK